MWRSARCVLVWFLKDGGAGVDRGELVAAVGWRPGELVSLRSLVSPICSSTDSLSSSERCCVLAACVGRLRTTEPV